MQCIALNNIQLILFHSITGNYFTNMCFQGPAK